MTHKSESKKQNSSGIFLKLATGVILCGLLVVNIIIFTKSIRLSDVIVQLDEDTQKLKKENFILKQELYVHNSLENLEIMAKNLGFTKEAEPHFLEKLDYASL
ncbi:hypothetical protein A3H80_00195 [Candidatus Roizmanbacteria bacterium RIFCSPLOWO2_02_FULL_37_19]|uniref:Uncharacterized protein n=1 Tax=Candidatus Roizmanbacteria bacterium RIFCSPHIGHO2_02_FULL_37_24 TaxID=1802037 RepID=A0A1F7GUZ7_9BACT|nr:MAG: hypothetical protein A3C24_04960 [Candidatus Roizmanbacteria bacterium RIFCSPHIGHO2_02_FULL_37_24]OGK32629.1 MAG: hypothetical protein A3E10_01375 [Candidatus Roizmanbacteria bacterium RIFCSPHIGHO2_12_FULL_37_23]OGK53943.1 MAG: hypothetical protein A3H80_00195 [Candidatus Roizmanbacteria bacterium RIFCSPLOWO2_02_FULL_37_19]